MYKTKTVFTADLRIVTDEGEAPDHFRARCEDFIKRMYDLSEEMGLTLDVRHAKAVTRYIDDGDSFEE